MNERQTELKHQFNESEKRLYEALIEHDSLPLSEETLTQLRQTVMTAQARCREAGVEVETLHEFGERRRRENEAAIQAYADEQKRLTPSLPRSTRSRIALSLGGVVAIGMAFVTHPMIAMIVGFLGYGGSYAGMTQCFPTPGTRVGRRAVALGVPYMSFWPEESDDHKDYRDACRRERLMGRAPLMIRTR